MINQSIHYYFWHGGFNHFGDSDNSCDSVQRRNFKYCNLISLPQGRVSHVLSRTNVLKLVH